MLKKYSVIITLLTTIFFIVLLVVNEYFNFLDPLLRTGIVIGLLGSNAIELINQIKKKIQ